MALKRDILDAGDHKAEITESAPTQPTEKKKEAKLTLSTNKQKFMDAGDFFNGPHRLTVHEIKENAKRLEQKHGIRFVINGETKSGITAIENKRQETIPIIQDLTDKSLDSKKYIRYFNEFWGKDQKPVIHKSEAAKYTLPAYWNSEQIDQINKELKEFKTPEGNLRTDLTRAEIIKLNFTIDTQFYPQFSKTINEHLIALRNFVIPKHTCIAEIKEIQSSLKEGEKVVYIYIEGEFKPDVSAHAEGFIVTPTQIIKPLYWGGFLVQRPQIEMTRMDLPDMYVPIHHPLVIGTTLNSENKTVLIPQNKLPIFPQADLDSCGTFTLLTNKELLQNNSKQLTELSLCFTYIDDKNKFINLFFTAPQPLRYSQRTPYNSLHIEMLKDADDLAHVVHDGNNYYTFPLQRMFKETISRAKSLGKQDIAEHSQRLLDALPDFRARWLDVYRNEVQPMIDLMTSEKHNQLVIYRGNRFKEKACGFFDARLSATNTVTNTTTETPKPQ